jgi:hypothetical protein
MLVSGLFANKGGVIMVRRLALAVLFSLAALPVGAADYSDVYYDPAEPGWGVFLVQSNTFQFLAFFIYGPDSKPIWYTAQLTDDGTGSYTGGLFSTTGTYFGSPWQGATIATVGSASFKPTDAYHATLTYSLTGGPTVTRPVQRQTLTPLVMGDNYSGSIAGTITGCADPAKNTSTFRGRYNLTVTQVADSSASLTFSYVDTTVCTLAGPLTHFGRIYRIADATYSCTGPGATPGTYAVTIDALHPTGQGIEGRWAGTIAGNCQVSMHFAAVIN